MNGFQVLIGCVQSAEGHLSDPWTVTTVQRKTMDSARQTPQHRFKTKQWGCAISETLQKDSSGIWKWCSTDERDVLKLEAARVYRLRRKETRKQHVVAARDISQQERSSPESGRWWNDRTQKTAVHFFHLRAIPQMLVNKASTAGNARISKYACNIRQKKCVKEVVGSEDSEAKCTRRSGDMVDVARQEQTRMSSGTGNRNEVRKEKVSGIEPAELRERASVFKVGRPNGDEGAPRCRRRPRTSQRGYSTSWRTPARTTCARLRRTRCPPAKLLLPRARNPDRKRHRAPRFRRGGKRTDEQASHAARTTGRERHISVPAYSIPATQSTPPPLSAPRAQRRRRGQPIQGCGDADLDADSKDRKGAGSNIMEEEWKGGGEGEREEDARDRTRAKEARWAKRGKGERKVRRRWEASDQRGETRGKKQGQTKERRDIDKGRQRGGKGRRVNDRRERGDVEMQRDDKEREMKVVVEGMENTEKPLPSSGKDERRLAYARQTNKADGVECKLRAPAVKAGRVGTVQALREGRRTASAPARCAAAFPNAGAARIRALAAKAATARTHHYRTSRTDAHTRRTHVERGTGTSAKRHPLDAHSSRAACRGARSPVHESRAHIERRAPGDGTSSALPQLESLLLASRAPSRPTAARPAYASPTSSKGLRGAAPPLDPSSFASRSPPPRARRTDRRGGTRKLPSLSSHPSLSSLPPFPPSFPTPDYHPNKDRARRSRCQYRALRHLAARLVSSAAAKDNFCAHACAGTKDIGRCGSPTPDAGPPRRWKTIPAHGCAGGRRIARCGASPLDAYPPRRRKAISARVNLREVGITRAAALPQLEAYHRGGGRRLRERDIARPFFGRIDRRGRKTVLRATGAGAAHTERREGAITQAAETSSLDAYPPGRWKAVCSVGAVRAARWDNAIIARCCDSLLDARVGAPRSNGRCARGTAKDSHTRAGPPARRISQRAASPAGFRGVDQVGGCCAEGQQGGRSRYCSLLSPYAVEGAHTQRRRRARRCIEEAKSAGNRSPGTGEWRRVVDRSAGRRCEMRIHRRAVGTGATREGLRRELAAACLSRRKHLSTRWDSPHPWQCRVRPDAYACLADEEERTAGVRRGSGTDVERQLAGGRGGRAQRLIRCPKLRKIRRPKSGATAPDTSHRARGGGRGGRRISPVLILNCKVERLGVVGEQQVVMS
ncbi:hypothetical protein C8R47DRAFT_1286198 [Mycena vitilis]|nr:hypothetical protein C8R47DRAFT_1286198 [Mycena vitilis]